MIVFESTKSTEVRDVLNITDTKKAILIKHHPN